MTQDALLDNSSDGQQQIASPLCGTVILWPHEVLLTCGAEELTSSSDSELLEMIADDPDENKYSSDSEDSTFSSLVSSNRVQEETQRHFESTVKQSLVDWVIECNIPRAHVSNLLKRLKNDANLHFLPLDRTTLLSSSRSRVALIDMPPGEYKHFNIVTSLKGVLHSMVSTGITDPQCLRLLVNIDGITVSKSSRSEFWPILVKVLGDSKNSLCLVPSLTVQ